MMKAAERLFAGDKEASRAETKDGRRHPPNIPDLAISTYATAAVASNTPIGGVTL
jgi:hypothetical protein